MVSLLCPRRIRDLNDEINKLIREKGHWERRIVELGEPDYAKTAPKITDSEGNELTDGRGPGYRWAGPRIAPGPVLSVLHSCVMTCYVTSLP